MGKQVKTPRFYVDIPTFLHATGREWALQEDLGGAELLYMNPSNPFKRELEALVPFKIGGGLGVRNLTSFPINFVALLNHNLASDSHNFVVQARYQDFVENEYDGYVWQVLTNRNNFNYTNILNAETASNPNIKPSYNGSSIFSIDDGNGNSINNHWESFMIKFNNTDEDGNNYDDYTHQLGSFVVGKYWDAPNSPDLSLTMSRRFDGIKKQKTIGGKTLANIYYDGPTEWTMHNRYLAAAPSQVYKYPQFELDNPDAAVDGQGIIGEHSFNKRAKSGLGRKGLRSWNLTFSYISESNMWMDNEVSNTLTSDDVTPNDNIPNPMLADESFNFVWNCTLGGTLPFIFQPDNSETGNNPDRFAICTFRNNTLSVKQVAFNTYSLSITIDEVA